MYEEEIERVKTKQLQKILSLILAIIMVFSILPITASATDYDGHWASEYITEANMRGWMTGYPDGSFGPDNSITRAEFTSMLWRALDEPAATISNPYTDVEANAWYYEAVIALYDAGIASGYGNGIFAPDDTLTREMGFAMLARAFGLTSNDLDTYKQFSDYSSVSSWAIAAASAMIEKGYVSGVGDNLLAPQKALSRGEMATLLVTVFDGEQKAEEVGAEIDGSGPTITLTQSPTNSTTGSVTVTVTIKDKDDVSYIGWRSSTSGASYTSNGGFTDITNAGKFTVTSNGWYAVCAVNTSGNFSYQLIQITNIKSSSSSGGGSGSGNGNSQDTDSTITPDSPFLNPNDESGGEITRQQWISQLVEHAELTMYNTDVTSSFSDVDDDNPYSWAIEIALQNGAIAISEDDGNKFYPERAATEAFAVVSAVRALGFVYTDLADCYEIANDCGIFSGTPTTNNLTFVQLDAILVAVDSIVAPIVIDPTAEQIVNYADDVVTLSDADIVGTYTFSDETSVGSACLTADAGARVAVGTCIILPPCNDYPGGLAQKITSIDEQQDGTFIIGTTVPTLDEVMGDGKIDIQGIASADLDDFEISDEFLEMFNVEIDSGNSNVDIEALYTRSDLASLSPLYLETQDISLLTSESKAKVKISYETDSKGNDYIKVVFEETDKQELFGEFKVYIPDIEYRADIDWFLFIPTSINELYLALNEQIEFEGGVRWESAGKSEKTLKLGTVKIPLSGIVFADVEIYLKWSVEGTMSIEYELNSTLGIQYKNGHLRNISQATNNLDFKPLKVEGKIGPEIAASLDIWDLKLADVSGYAGIGATASATIRDTSNICVDGKVYLFAELAAMQKSVLNNLVDLSAKWKIWDKNNSVWKVNKHFEGTPTHVGFVSECTFGEGDVVGIVKDAATGSAINFFTVTATKTDGDGTANSKSGTISANGSFNIDDLPTGTYTITISASGYQTYTKENVTVRVNQTTNVGTLLLVSSDATTGSASGYVTDSQTGNPVSGATVTLYFGDGTTSSTGRAATTDAAGLFSFSDVVTGNYTIVVSKSDYSSGSRSIVVTEAGQANQNVTLIPIGVSGDYDTSVDVGTYTQIGDLRIVLTWGEYPYDLDSHLCGPTSSGASRFHVYFANKYYNENDHVHSFLDHDDVTSYGPETTTVYDINTSGKYSFYVHDFTNGGATASTALSESDATVRVYVKEATGEVNADGQPLYRAKLIGTFYVPSASQGTLWHVFDYNAATGTLTARNLMTTDTGSSNVGRSAGPDEEQQIDIDMIRQDIVNK